MLYKIQENAFDIVVALTYIIYIAATLGIATFSPKYIDEIDFWFKLYICFFLIWRFHPFVERKKFTELDRKIAFSAGCFLLATTAVNQYLLQILDTVKQKTGLTTTNQ
jgi:uncharacterized BrkB/YihY/UPF0761 family membrane protein